MDLYITVFGRVNCRDIEVFKRHRAGDTFSALAKSFNLSRQRCQQIYSTIEWKIKLFTMLMKTNIEKSRKNFIEKYNPALHLTEYRK